jgi:hypothetical protein
MKILTEEINKACVEQKNLHTEEIHNLQSSP